MPTYEEYFDDFYELKDRAASVTKGNERKATRTWFSLSNDPLVCTKMAEDYFAFKSGITLGSPYQSAYVTDPTCLAMSWSTRDMGAKDGKEFESVVQYGKLDESNQNPLQARVEYTSNFSLQNQIVDITVDGRDIVNVVGDLFDPPLEEGYPHLVMQWRRNEASWSESVASMYQGSINMDWWRGFPPLTCHIRHLGATSATAQNYPDYYKVTYQVEVDNNKWVRKVMNIGFRAKNVDNDFFHYISTDGQKGNIPGRLALDGTELTEEEPSTWLYFNTKPIVPFGPVLNF